jgi:hypothetical protein
MNIPAKCLPSGRPGSLTVPSWRRQAIKDNWATAVAITEGLGKTVLRRAWHINPPHDRIVFTLQGRSLYIHGFPGRREVFSLITEEQGKIIGRFYANAADANKGEHLLKTVIFSERSATGKWLPLSTPKLIYTDPAASVQFNFLRTRQLKQFLLDDRESGASFDVGERKIVKSRALFRMGAETIGLCGFSGFTKVTGRIIAYKKRKVIYFWPDEAAKQGNARPIIPPGQTVALKARGGQWEIVWLDQSRGSSRSYFDSKKLGNFIFATVGDRVLTTAWPVKAFPSNGDRTPQAVRRIRGKKFTVSTFMLKGRRAWVVSQVREFAGRLKLIEFWQSERAIEANASPFAARFISYKPANGKWTNFWHPAGGSAATAAAVQKLVARGAASYEELKGILSNDYFIRRGYWDANSAP